MTATATDRRPDIDWLRVLATLLVVVFHAAMVFNPAPFYHIRNSDLSFAVLVFCGFVNLWHMPLFFVLAGWSLARAIGSRSIGDILKERTTRLARARRPSFEMRPVIAWAPVPLLAVVQVVPRAHWPGIQNLYDD